jgi:diguanylate cyclase (GGDEF)-like protein/PAS domain S-box-containing protein
MGLTRLSRDSIVGCTVGLLILVTVGGMAHGRMHEKQAEVAQLIELQERLDGFSADSDRLLLFDDDEQVWRTFRENAESLQQRLRSMAGTHSTAQTAIREIGPIVEAVRSARALPGSGSGNGVTTAVATGPLDIPARARNIMNAVANHGVALDTAVNGLLHERQQAIATEATWVAGSFAGAALLFALLSLTAFGLIHRRIGGPVQELAATIDRIRAGEPGLRAADNGNNELSRLARAFNQLLDERAAADERLAEQQRALRDREGMLRDSQRIAHVGAWRHDIADGRVEWSDETYHIAGVSPATFTPTWEAFLELVHPDDVERSREIQAAAMEGRRPHDIEFRLIRPDGGVRRVHERAELEFDPEGEPLRLSGTIQDVTDYQMAQERVEQYRRLVDSSNDLFCVIDEEYRYVLANDAYAALYGLDQASIEGLHLLDVLSPGFFEGEAKPPIDRCLAGEPQTFEGDRTYPHLGERRLLIRYHPIPSADGRIRQVGSVLTDVTEIRQREHALREQARLLDMAGRVARLGGWSVDLDTGRITWSEVVAEIHRMPYPSSPTLEDGITFYAPEYRERVRALVNGCVTDGTPWDEELQIIDAFGERVWDRTVGEPVRDEEGRISRIQGAFQDISKSKAVDLELERLNQRLTNILESITDAFFTLDLEWRFDYVNTAAERLLDRRAEDLVSRNVWAEFPAAVGTPIEREYHRAMRDNVTVALEEYYEPLGLWFDIRAYPSEEGLSVYFRDVSERHAMEDQLREQREALQASRDELAAVLDVRQRLINSLPAHISLLDSEGNILDVNEQWRHFGLENDNADPQLGVGTNYLSVCERAGGECAEGAQQAADGIRAVLKGDQSTFAMEYPCHSPEKERWFRVMVNRLGGGQALGAVVMHIDITERKQAEQELNRLAFEDPLTGLPSRNGFVQIIEEHVRHAGWQADGMVVVLDIEGQRDVNDFHGFDAGDRCLVEIGKRLRRETGTDTVVARTGGDEFAVFVPATNTHTPEERRAAIAAVFWRPFPLDEVSVQTNARFGYTEMGAIERPLDSLLREAELALFRSRERNTPERWTAYSNALKEESHNRIEVTRELRRALDADEFELHFHPKVELASGRLVSGEALIRWNHPERGLLSPGAFIPVAEKSHLIAPIGDWALRDACRQLREWQDDHLGIVRIAVNVSLIQFSVGDFAGTVADAIDAFDIDPHSLTLEITESVFERESQRLLEQLRRIHEMGVRLSLDDFGTGYSSLLYLQKYPFDEIKIDQGFVRGILDDEYSQRVVTTVMGLASALGAEVVAEGIETDQLREALLDLGCPVGQGYYYSMPMVAEDFRWLLEQQSTLPLPLTASGGE